MADRILRSPVISPVGSIADAMPAAVRNAINEAYQRGLVEGYERARGDLAAHTAVLAAKVAEADVTLTRAVQRAVAHDAATTVDLAVELAEWFVGETLLDDPETMRAGIAALIDDLDLRGVHTLFVHPDIADSLGSALPDGVTCVEADRSLSPGELRMTTNGATIERDWTHAFERVRDALVAQLRAEAAAGSPDSMAS